MKKAVAVLILFLLAFAVVGNANAAVLVRNNGGFDASAAGWNATGGGAWAPTYAATGGNPGGYVTLQSAPGAWSVWYEAINESLAVWGIPAGTTITAQVDMIDLGTTNSSQGGLKVESWAAALLNDGSSQFTVTNSWATYSFDYTINPAATAIKFVFTDVPTLGLAKYGFDNASIAIAGVQTQPALLPVPNIDKAVAPANDVLSWTNPAPKNPSDTIICDVWFRDGGTAPLADPNLVPGQPGAAKIVTGEAISSVDLSARGVTLLQDHYYYWKVNVTDPNSGASNGFTWAFNTLDAPPYNVNAGADQYVWLTSGTKTFTLTGSYSDDGKSPVTKLWTLNPLTQTDPATVVTIATPTALSTNVTVNGTGWFFFDFTVTDGVGSSVDTVNVGVYVDACAAAHADPTDIAARYPNGDGDINGDCHVDLNDFVIMARTWLNCMSAKLGCTP